MKCYQAILFQLQDYSVFTFLYEKNTPLWSQQISFLNDYEATREARMLQAPIKGRKLARSWKAAVEGVSGNSPRHASC